MKFVIPFLKRIKKSKKQRYFKKYLIQIQKIEMDLVLEFWVGLEKSKKYHPKFGHDLKHEDHHQKCAIQVFQMIYYKPL